MARREAVEEAGLEIAELIPITSYYGHPAKSSERFHMFCGRVDASRAGVVHGLHHEREDIRVLPMPVDAALDLLAQGRINSAWPMIALLWLGQNRESLKACWSKGN